MNTRIRVETVVEPPAIEAPWHQKYRPTSLDDVLGQTATVRSLQDALKAKSRQHCFFFFGPGGTGKTTLARIMAAQFGCDPANITEVDAASNSGIDEMRKVTEAMRYSGFGENPNRAYVIDECHRLSKNAWDSLLKSTEEPPEHVFFFFCSTDPSKIPKPMLTRGPNHVLNAVRYDDLMDLLEYVAVQEDLSTPPEVLGTVARASEGSPRQALVMLAMAQGCLNAKEAEETLQGVGETPEVIDLCRALVKGRLSWSEVQQKLAPIEDQGAEGIRIQVALYLARVLMNTKKDVPYLLDVLDAFSTPCNPTDKLAPLLLAFGKFTNL